MKTVTPLMSGVGTPLSVRSAELVSVQKLRPLIAALILGAVVVLLALGSLAPFEFAVPPAGGAGVGQLGWPHSDAVDLAVNFAGYLPLGMSCVAFLRWRFGRLPSIVLAVVLGASMSFTLESLQGGIVARYASWIDVIANGCGTLGGALALSCLAAWMSGVRLAAHPARVRRLKIGT